MPRFMKRTLLLLSIILALAASTARAQYLSIGAQVGPNVSGFNSPNLDNIVTGRGVGYQLGFFVRFGYRLYYELDFNWIRAETDIRVDLGSIIVEDKVPLHNFDLTAKVGYQLVRKEKFRWRVNSGPFLAWPALFSTNVFQFEGSDLRRPQWGMQFGTGIDYKRFNFDIDYNLHISLLFKGAEEDLGSAYGSRLHVILFKFGYHI